MKKHLFLAVFVMVILAGCTQQAVMDMEEHIGCQEDEIVDGKCAVAEDNNRMLFGQDLDKYVDSADLSIIRGFLAKPKQDGDYPGVVMIHEWWGLNDNIKEMAKILAKEGYVVLAVDLYGDVATESSRARELATAVRQNPEQAVADMKAAVEYLHNAGVAKVASIGWCFGGQHSLLLSLNEKLDATVIYYGQLTDDKEQLKKITWPVLGIFGSEDSSITVESVRSFESALDEIGISNEIYVYDGVGHAFANPSGSNYAMEETLDAWEKTVKFLDNSLKQGSKAPAYVDVSPAEAKELIDTVPELVVIDVSPYYASGHLPGAVSYYLGDGSLDNAIPALDPEGIYLVYCHVDSVAILGAQKLVDAGFKNVYRLEGNYAGWVAAGYPVES